MALGVVMFLDEVAKLGGGVVTTLGVGASTIGGVICCLAMIPASNWMSRMCSILSVVDLGSVPPNTLRRSAAATMERSCCNVTGTRQCTGYKHQVSEKWKRCIAGL